MIDFSIVAFNCHWGVGRFGEERGKPFDVARLIETWDADLVVVPEAVRTLAGVSTLEALADAGYHVEYAHLMRLNLRRDYSRLRDMAPHDGIWELGICSRFPVLSRREIVIGKFKVDPVGSRRALAVTVDVGGTPVELIGLHTSSHLLSLAPVRHLLGLKRQLTDSGPQIIAGDFNFWGPPIGMLMQGWERPVRGRTYPGHRPHSQIDHVLVRGGITPLSGEVLAATPSDHRPVRARLRLLP